MRYSIYDLTRWGVLTALALTLSVTESLFFPDALLPVPGIRLGLANIVTLLAIYYFGAFPTILIVCIRCLVTFGFGGSLMGFLFSLSGGILALCIMTHFQSMISIILPQIGNNLIINIKDTAVLAVISVTELFFAAKTLDGMYYQTFPVYLIVCAMYFVMLARSARSEPLKCPISSRR